MGSNENIQLVRRLFKDVFTGHNIELLDQLFSKNIKLHDIAVPKLKGGLNELKKLEQMYTEAFPNKKTKIDDIFAFDDKVLVRWTVAGTHTGPLADMGPTNKNVKLSGMSLYQISNGKIAEIWQEWDRLGLMQQIGEVTAVHALQ